MAMINHTHFKLADVKRMDENIKKFISVWTAFCQERINEKKLTRWLGKDKVTFNFDPTIALNEKLNSDELGAVSKHSISKDSIQSYIYNYNLAEKEGIGFVVILECFDNARKRTSAYFTFFDITTKQLLMSQYISSFDGNSYNRVSNWGAGLVIAFRKFFVPYKEKRRMYTAAELTPKD